MPWRLLLVIVHDLNVVGVAVPPAEANAPLIVDANAMVASAIAFELFEPIVRWHAEILELLGGVDEAQLAEHDPVKLGREPAHGFALEQTFGVAIAEALDHWV
jgi:hypothetical protein